MRPDFNFILVSGKDNGMDFVNSCNEALDFQETPYEVCLQEMMFSIGAWDNVRAGANAITIKLVNGQRVNAYVTPGRYTNTPDLIKAINDAMIPISNFALIRKPLRAGRTCKVLATVVWRNLAMPYPT